MSARPTRATTAGRIYLDLRKRAKEQGRPTAELQQLYALEGFLTRLPASMHAHRFVLKGGVLLAAFDARRATKDVDLAATGLSNNPESVRTAVANVLEVEIDDGLTFAIEGMQAQTIRESDSYSGVRVSIPCQLATATVDFHVDVNVGDPISPPAQTITIPRLLGGDPIEVIGYPISMVLAEKIVTAIERGIANTRWRDFADLFILSRKHAVDAADLRRSIQAVANHRETTPTSLTDSLEGLAQIAQPRWTAWLRRSRQPDVPDELTEVLEHIAAFADPLLSGSPPTGRWTPDSAEWT